MRLAHREVGPKRFGGIDAIGAAGGVPPAIEDSAHGGVVRLGPLARPDGGDDVTLVFAKAGFGVGDVAVQRVAQSLRFGGIGRAVLTEDGGALCGAFEAKIGEGVDPVEREVMVHAPHDQALLGRRTEEIDDRQQRPFVGGEFIGDADRRRRMQGPDQQVRLALYKGPDGAQKCFVTRLQIVVGEHPDDLARHIRLAAEAGHGVDTRGV